MKNQKQIKNSLLLWVLFSSFILNAQNIDKYYVNIPDHINPTLNKQNRLELLEYFKASKIDSIDNVFKQKAYLLAFDTVSQYVKVQTTAVSTFEMKVLITNRSTPVIGIISTVCAPVCQSYICFYDTTWNKVSIQFEMPKAVEWLDKDKLETSVIDKQWIVSVLENNFISLSFDKDEIVATNNSLAYMGEAERKSIDSFVTKAPFVFRLKGEIWEKK